MPIASPSNDPTITAPVTSAAFRIRINISEYLFKIESNQSYRDWLTIDPDGPGTPYNSYNRTGEDRLPEEFASLAWSQRLSDMPTVHSLVLKRDGTAAPTNQSPFRTTGPVGRPKAMPGTHPLTLPS